MSSFPRAAALAGALIALLPIMPALSRPQATPAPAPSTQSAPTGLVPVPQTADTPWLFKGSDIPPDRAWTFGVLPNGVRYAVRANGVPPGQVAIRVAIDAGSLMERENERGFAHLIEHLAFRGSVHVPDGESKRVWQRLGVTFGSDTNASTSFTQTSYKLDLPSATAEGLDTSLKILAGMMAQPTIDATALNAERPVVLAEQREQPGPQVRLGDASRALFFRGQLIADRSPIGNVATLEAATPESVREFHRRWYRPERAVVVVVGDADPKLLEAAVIKHFSGWRGEGAAVPQPDFGTPTPDGPATAAIVEPALPTLVSAAIVRPWTVGDDTILFNQERMVELVAVQVVNRRLESRARGGASYISAGAELDDISRSANVTSLSILPLGNDWEAALRDVRATIDEAVRTPIAPSEIARELAVIESAMKNAVATAPVEAGARIADNLVSAVDIRETVAGPQTSLQIFEGAVAQNFFTPARVQAAAKKAFTGVATRAIVSTPAPDATAATRLAAALDADVSAVAATRGKVRDVSIDDLPRLGRPGKVVARTTALTSPAIEQIDFANGAKLLLFPNAGETGKVYVRVRFGNGLNALPADRAVPAYAADLALIAGGIGKLGQEELDRITAGRRLGLDFAIDDDAFVLGGLTTADDLKDQLRLIATKLDYPAWDPKPVARVKAVLLASYDSLSASPDAVLSRDLERLLHDGDPRWGAPTRAQIEALDAKSFRDLWAPLLASGPIEVQVFGDVAPDAAVQAVAATIGAMKPRAPVALTPPPVRFPDHVAEPVVRRHTGQPNQAAAVIAWPTGGGSDALGESRRLEILAAIFRDRLLDRLRSQAGLSYTPNVVNQWPVGMSAGGTMLAIGMIPPDRTRDFFTLAREIAADLVARPVEMDELRRAQAPVLQFYQRSATGNQFWMQQTAGGTGDPKRLAAIGTLGTDLRDVTPEALQALAARYLRPERDWSLVVLPDEAVLAAAAQAAPAR